VSPGVRVVEEKIELVVHIDDIPRDRGVESWT